MELDRETAREHFCILYDALYRFDRAGGSLHILVDDNNTDDQSIEWLDKEWMPKCKNTTHDAQWAVERALLDLFMRFDQKDRDYILHGYDL